MSNQNLNNAKHIKNDEFYTPLSEIHHGLDRYKNEFYGKKIYCNCDDPYRSNFVRYFLSNFNKLHLKSFTATCFVDNKQGLCLKVKSIPSLFVNEKYELKNIINAVLNYDPKRNKLYQLDSTGSFDSIECIKLLKKNDIIITNPPFSLFRRYFNILVHYKKQYCLIANALCFFNQKPIELLKSNKLRAFQAYGDFITPENEIKNIKTTWLSNLNIDYIQYESELFRFTTKHHAFNENTYNVYDNYKNIIDVPKLSKIPNDYFGVIGVPITYCMFHNPSLFKILATSNKDLLESDLIDSYDDKFEYNNVIDGYRKFNPVINNKMTFGRVFIMRI